MWWEKDANTIFTLFKASRLLLDPNTQLLADSRYQGIIGYHLNSLIPFKKKKGQSLTTKEKSHNKILSKKRILIENVNRQCKIFWIVKDIYHGKHKNYALNWHLIKAIVNLRYAARSFYLGKMSTVDGSNGVVRQSLEKLLTKINKTTLIARIFFRWKIYFYPKYSDSDID